MAELALKIPHPAVEIHALRREELEQLRDHLLRLDTECRFERFGHGLGKAALAQYAARSLDHGDLRIEIVHHQTRLRYDPSLTEMPVHELLQRKRWLQ